jgi:hypothetical protein
MKKALIFLMLLGLAAGLLAVTGCGSNDQTNKTPAGETRVEEDKDGGKVTYQTEEGDVTYDVSDRPPTEEELGAPIYPGADYVPGSGGVVKSSGPEGEFSTAGAEFKTEDGYEDVVGYYSDKLGAPMYEDASTKEATWMINLAEESFTVVTVSVEDGGVVISIGRMAGTP